MLALILPLYIIFLNTVSGCLLPVPQGSWYSTTHGTWLVSTKASKTYVQNFKSSVSQMTTTLECINNTDTKYILGTTLEVFGTNFSAYICLDIQPSGSSPDAFVYYIATPLETSTGEPFSFYKKDACSKPNYNTAINAHLLIRAGSETASAISCPEVLHGEYNVEVEEQGGSVTKGIDMDSCSDNKLMVFTNVDLSHNLGFTHGNILHCLYYVTSESNVYLHTYNNDTSVDNVNTVRVACWVIENTGVHVRATVFPGQCITGQNATSVPVGGQVFVYSPSDAAISRLPTTTRSVATSSVSTTTASSTSVSTSNTTDTSTTTISTTTKGQASSGCNDEATWIFVAIMLLVHVLLTS